MEFLAGSWIWIALVAALVMFVAVRFYIGYNNKSRQNVSARNNSISAGRDVNINSNGKEDKSK